MAKLSDYIKLQPKQQEALQHIGTGSMLFYGGSRGGGKAVSITDTVVTPFGNKQVGDLKVGDVLVNPDGTPQKIIQVHPIVKQPVYRLFFEDGLWSDCSLEHLWFVRKTSSTSKTGNDSLIWTTESIIEWLDKKTAADENATIKQQHLTIPLTEPVRFTRTYKYNIRTIHPYLLGVLIGDGTLTMTTTNTCSYSKPDMEIAERLRIFGHDVISGANNRWVVRIDNIATQLDKLGLNNKLANAKFIPEQYKYDTLENRLLLVQGLMDTDGYVDDRGHLSYTTVSKQLALDFQWLVRSLGAKATITEKIGAYKNDNNEKIECQLAYTIYFNSKLNDKMVWLPRKQQRTKTVFNGGVSELRRRIVGYEYIGELPARCITVSNPNGLFLTNDFIVTHNSHLALAAAVIVALRYPGIKIMCVRHTYPELEEVFIVPLQTLYPAKHFKYNYRNQQKVAVFANGSRIVFKAVESEKDVKKVQGVEYQFLVVDEAPNFEIIVIQKMLGSLRKGMQGFIPTALMTGNPGGLSDRYFKTRFIYPDYSVWEEGELEIAEKYIFISAKVADNQYVGEEYVRMLRSMPEHLRKAWLDGDWNVFEGQFFEWNADIVCESFDIPKDWRRVAGFDLGYTKKHPAVALYAAQNPETEDIYIYREYTGVGSIEMYVNDLKSIPDEDEEYILFVDPSMFTNNKRYEYDESPGKMFQNSGLPVLPANNDRINGWRIVKAWMQKKLHIFDICPTLITTLPTLKYTSFNTGKKEDLDTKMADDAADALRYLLVSGFGFPSAHEDDTITKYTKDKLLKTNDGRHSSWVKSVTHNAYY